MVAEYNHFHFAVKVPFFYGNCVIVTEISRRKDGPMNGVGWRNAFSG